MILRAVGAARGRGHTAIENWFEVPSVGGGRVGVAVFCCSVRAGAERAYGRVLASEFEMAKRPTAVALFGVEKGVGSLNNIVATEDRNLGGVGRGLPVFGRNLHYD